MASCACEPTATPSRASPTGRAVESAARPRQPRSEGPARAVVYRDLRVIVIAPCYDEEAKIGSVVSRVPRPLVDEVLVVDDGSRDRSAEVARAAGARVLSLGAVRGVGAALRAGVRHGLAHTFDVLVVVAGN